MACSNCKEVIDPTIPFTTFDYSVSKRSIEGHAITDSLIRIPAKPAKGWSVLLPLKGQLQKIHGQNPRDVAYNAKKLYELNGLQVDNTSLWFNLNVQWLQRTNEKYHIVSLSKLLEFASPEIVVNDDPHAIQKISDSWIQTVAESIKIHLQAEDYKWDEFLQILNRFQRYLNPAENPLLGDSKRYISFTLRLDKVKRSPIYDREQAKKWFNEIQF